LAGDPGHQGDLLIGRMFESMRSRAMSCFEKRVPALLAMLFTIPSALAGWAPTPAEMAALPPFCTARFNEGSESFKSWSVTMGGDFIHIHHYCAGLNFLNRARGSVSSKNSDTLGAVVREFDYVLTHANPRFYMRSEILANRGVALSMMKRDGEAVNNLLQALELNAKQPRAWMALTDLYDRQKNRSKALQTVSEGLRHNPDTRSLQRRYTELGGTLPYPAPSESTAAAVAAKPDEAAPPAVVPANPAEPAADMPPPVAEPVAPPKIGSPTNPYCRFCPD
jgi:tetratricopeptide (TPR) repeat protein